MSSEQRNTVLIKLAGVLVVVGVLWLTANSPLRDYPLAANTIPAIIAGIFSAIGFAGNRDAIVTRLRSMAPEKREELIRSSMIPHAPKVPTAITFVNADEVPPPPSAATGVESPSVDNSKPNPQ